jgi:hypothetical protein
MGRKADLLNGPPSPKIERIPPPSAPCGCRVNRAIDVQRLAPQAAGVDVTMRGLDVNVRAPQTASSSLLAAEHRLAA